MILGIGTDIVAIERIGAVQRRHPQRFARRILAPGEMREFENAGRPIHFLAKRYAAKEAAAKALGRGIGGGVSWQDFQVAHEPGGRPLLKISGTAAELLAVGEPVQAHLSLSDERDYVVAYVVLESRATASSQP